MCYTFYARYYSELPMSTSSTTFILPDLLAIFKHAAADDPTSSLNPNFVEAEQAFEAWYRGKAVELPAEVYKVCLDVLHLLSVPVTMHSPDLGRGPNPYVHCLLLSSCEPRPPWISEWRIFLLIPDGDDDVGDSGRERCIVQLTQQHCP